ncbi:MAG TPA: hypothetical protein VMK66_11155 [Myxococcales bacterium]|nr:hypothetical protein [Myxococcales bacterium]
MRPLLVALFTLGCGEVHFVDPNPPQLFRDALHYTSRAIDEPVAWIAILDLFLEESGNCASAKESTLAAIRSAFAAAGGRQMELPGQDLAPDCKVREAVSIDVRAPAAPAAAPPGKGAGGGPELRDEVMKKLAKERARERAERADAREKAEAKKAAASAALARARRDLLLAALRARADTLRGCVPGEAEAVQVPLRLHLLRGGAVRSVEFTGEPPPRKLRECVRTVATGWNFADLKLPSDLELFATLALSPGA